MLCRKRQEKNRLRRKFLRVLLLKEVRESIGRARALAKLRLGKLERKASVQQLNKKEGLTKLKKQEHVF